MPAPPNDQNHRPATKGPKSFEKTPPDMPLLVEGLRACRCHAPIQFMKLAISKLDDLMPIPRSARNAANISPSIPIMPDRFNSLHALALREPVVTNKAKTGSATHGYADQQRVTPRCRRHRLFPELLHQPNPEFLGFLIELLDSALLDLPAKSRAASE